MTVKNLTEFDSKKSGVPYKVGEKNASIRPHNIVDSPTIVIHPKPVCNKRNIRPTKVSCPAGCGKEFVGKDPKLGVLRQLRTYAKQWKKYQEAQESGGVRLTKDLDDIEKHWEEHKKSII